MPFFGPGAEVSVDIDGTRFARGIESWRAPRLPTVETSTVCIQRNRWLVRLRIEAHQLDYPHHCIDVGLNLRWRPSVKPRKQKLVAFRKSEYAVAAQELDFLRRQTANLYSESIRKLHQHLIIARLGENTGDDTAQHHRSKYRTR